MYKKKSVNTLTHVGVVKCIDHTAKFPEHHLENILYITFSLKFSD